MSLKSYTKYKVGGCVRDKILGIESTDIDYVVVSDMSLSNLEAELTEIGYKIFVTIPERNTIRCKMTGSKQIFDFILTNDLKDDVLRRDFTMNCLLEDEHGKVIDLVGGLQDIESKLIKCPISPNITISNDPIRIFRAFRFAIKFNFRIDLELWNAIRTFAVEEFENIRIDKMVEEMQKMFRLDTMKSIDYFHRLKHLNEPLYEYIFKRVWLRANLIKK